MSGRPLRLQAVSWWFKRGRTVLNGIDLDVAPGECVVVRGANGSGKTTLARLAAGVLIARTGRAERARSMAYVPQASDDPPVRMRADRFLDALARMRGTRPSDDVVDALGLRPFVERPMNELSTGTVVKVLIAAAVTGSPQLLVCDEPFADLDAAGHDAVRDLVAAVRTRGGGVLLTDHGETSRALADRELVLRDGRLDG